MIASPQMEVLQTPVGDPSKETKEDLTAKGTSCLMDAGAAMKFIVRNSHLHEVRPENLTAISWSHQRD
jgi:hypothetical protein